MNASMFVHLFHILIVGGLFLYVGIMRNRICAWVYPILIGMSVLVFGYHLYKLYLRVVADKPTWVSWIHIIYVAPLLFFIGYNKENTPRFVYELLLMFAFGAIGYHGLYLANDLGVIFDYSRRTDKGGSS